MILNKLCEDMRLSDEERKIGDLDSSHPVRERKRFAFKTVLEWFAGELLRTIFLEPQSRESLVHRCRDTVHLFLLVDNQSLSNANLDANYKSY